MSPAAIQPEEDLAVRTSSDRKPLKSSGSLDQYKHFDISIEVVSIKWLSDVKVFNKLFFISELI